MSNSNAELAGDPDDSAAAFCLSACEQVHDWWPRVPNDVEVSSWYTTYDYNTFTEDTATAAVVCNQLGFKPPGQWTWNPVNVYGEGKGPMHVRRIVCNGTEPGIEYCAHDGWGIADPTESYNILGITCTPP